MSRRQIRKIATQLNKFFNKYHICGIKMWFNDDMWEYPTQSVLELDQKLERKITKNCDTKASYYSEYANDKTMTIIFEESLLYEILNYCVLPKLEDEFYKIFTDNGYYYELGNAWNLSVYESC